MASNTLPTREQFLQGSIIKPDTCSICLETFDEKHSIVRIDTPNCQHVFGKPCIENWFKDNGTCPACRTVLFTIPTVPPPPPRLDSIDDAQLARNFVDSLLAKIAYHANTNRELKVCHMIFFLEDAHALHGRESHVPHDNLQYALMGVLFSMFCTVKFDNWRCSDDTRFWVDHMGRALGWPAHVTGDNPIDENEDDDENYDEDEDEDCVD